MSNIRSTTSEKRKAVDTFSHHYGPNSNNFNAAVTSCSSSSSTSGVGMAVGMNFAAQSQPSISMHQPQSVSANPSIVKQNINFSSGHNVFEFGTDSGSRGCADVPMAVDVCQQPAFKRRRPQKETQVHNPVICQSVVQPLAQTNFNSCTNLASGTLNQNTSSMPSSSSSIRRIPQQLCRRRSGRLRHNLVDPVTNNNSARSSTGFAASSATAFAFSDTIFAQPPQRPGLDATGVFHFGS